MCCISEVFVIFERSGRRTECLHRMNGWVVGGGSANAKVRGYILPSF